MNLIFTVEQIARIVYSGMTPLYEKAGISVKSYDSFNEHRVALIRRIERFKVIFDKNRELVNSTILYKESPIHKLCHDIWMKTVIKKGWKYGPVRDYIKKEHPAIVAYEKTSPMYKYLQYHINNMIHILLIGKTSLMETVYAECLDLELDNMFTEMWNITDLKCDVWASVNDDILQNLYKTNLSVTVIHDYISNYTNILLQQHMIKNCNVFICDKYTYEIPIAIKENKPIILINNNLNKKYIKTISSHIVNDYYTIGGDFNFALCKDTPEDLEKTVYDAKLLNNKL